MRSSEKTRNTKELDLERDIPLSEEDVQQMQSPRLSEVDLAAYLDFLEEIRAFETKRPKESLDDTLFEL